MKRILAACCLILCSLFIFNACSKEESNQESVSTTKQMDIIAYYAGDSSTFKRYATEQLTHIIYSFLYLKDNQISFDKQEDSITLASLVKLKEKNPSLKILISLGGWGGCETCSQVFSTDKGREEFAQSVKQLLVKTHTDGIDLDWEYPAVEGFPGHRFVSEDKHHFTLLVQTLRKTLGEQYEISFAVGGLTECLEKSIEWKEVMPSVNRVHVMSYDLVNGNSVKTGHHTPLYSTAQQKESTDHGVRFLDSVGVPLNKIVIGAAFYARIFNEVDSTNHGLYRSGKFKTTVTFKDFRDSLQDFNIYWDSIAKAPYAYNTDRKEFATFDNKESVAAKVNYIKDKQLGGIMFWQLAGDKTQNGLLETIYRINNPSTLDMNNSRITN